MALYRYELTGELYDDDEIRWVSQQRRSVPSTRTPNRGGGMVDLNADVRTVAPVRATAAPADRGRRGQGACQFSRHRSSPSWPVQTHGSGGRPSPSRTAGPSWPHCLTCPQGD
jgi:hypothetical protein